MLVPEIKGYSFQNTFDSISGNLKSQAIRNTNKQPKGFTDLLTNLIKVPPGNSIEILIRKKGLNLDSCIEYRLYNTKKQADTNWHKSGHLLALTKLHSNSNTILDLRYTGMSSYNRYYLQIAPFWYEQPRSKFILSFMALLTVFLITYLTYKRRLRKEVNQRRQAEEQLRMVQSQLNPHFVFNALSTIEALVTNNENERANEYLTTFSDMMRDTLKNSRILFVSLSDDIAMLERYLTVEQLRFGFSFVMEIDPHLNIDLIEFPPMLLQPSLENAVKHGVSATGNAGIIILRYIKHKHDLVIQIVDNGKARSKQHSKGTGMGIRFTKERVRNLQKLCKEDNMKYDISITGNGTIVDFHFQNWLAK